MAEIEILTRHHHILLSGIYNMSEGIPMSIIKNKPYLSPYEHQ